MERNKSQFITTGAVGSMTVNAGNLSTDDEENLGERNVVMQNNAKNRMVLIWE